MSGDLGITAVQQWPEHLSSVQIAKQFGMEESMKDLITGRRHVARMRIPNKMLFGWLPQRRSAHGTKMRWRDRVRIDLKRFLIEEKR